MAKSYGRVHRLLKILTLIRSGCWNATQLAEELGTTVRNVYRDLKMLEGAGIPYYFDKELGCYQIRREFFLPPVDLTVEESLALLAAAVQIGGREQIPFLEPLERASQKVLAHLPEPVKEHLNDTREHLAIELARYGPGEEVRDVYRDVRAAIGTRRALCCSYESAGSGRGGTHDGECFRFDPYCLYWGQRAWYAVGFHHGRDEVRTLKLNRFVSVQRTDQPYVIPSSFSLQQHLGKAWRMIRGERTYRVELHFDADFAETVTDTRWHPSQAEEWLPDGSVSLRFEVDGLDEIVWWVLSMGPHCVVRKPAELARRVRDLAAKTAGLYGEERTVGRGSRRMGCETRREPETVRKSSR